MSQQPQPASGASAANLEFYDQATDGNNDYWDLMAAPRWRVQTLRALLAEQRPAQVVDLGCGNGALLESLGSAIPNAKRVGIDLAPAQMERNRKEKPHIEWHVADLADTTAKLPDAVEGRFDAVVATEIIEHLERPEDFLALTLKLAKPGGMLYLTTQSGPVHQTEKMVGHVQHFTSERITRMIADSGWKPERVWNAGFPFHNLSKKVANLNPEGMIKQFSGRRYTWKERFAAALLRASFHFNLQSSGYQLFAVARKP